MPVIENILAPLLVSSFFWIVSSYESEDTFCSKFSTEFPDKLELSTSREHLDMEITTIALYTTAKLEALSNRYTFGMQKSDPRIEWIFRCTARAKNEIFRKYTSPGNADSIKKLKGIILSMTDNQWLPQHTQQVHTICKDIVRTNRTIAGREWYNVRKYPCHDWKLQPYPGFCIFSLKRNLDDNVTGTSHILSVIANIQQHLSNELAEIEHSIKWGYSNEAYQQLLIQNAQAIRIKMDERLDRIQQKGYENVDEIFLEYADQIYAVGFKAIEELNAFIFKIAF